MQSLCSNIFEKQLSFAVIILGFAIIWIFLLSDFKENVDNKPRIPIHFENELTWDVATMKSLFLNSCRNSLYKYACLCIPRRKYTPPMPSAIGFCGDEVSAQMLPLGVMVMMMNTHPKELLSEHQNLVQRSRKRGGLQFA